MTNELRGVEAARDEEIERLTRERDTYEEILRVVCGHLELPQSESGPADDIALYDRALEQADVMYRQTEAERVEHMGARYWAESEIVFISKEARRYASHYPEASDGRNTFIIFAEMVERRLKTHASSALAQPKAGDNAEVEPVAWLVKIYDNGGMLLDTRLEFVKHSIRSTARTEFIPLFAKEDAKGGDGERLNVQISQYAYERDLARRERDEAIALADRLKLEAQAHAMEARTATSTVNECYQAVTGSTGEPGNWHGANPVREYVARAEAKLSALQSERAGSGEAVRVTIKPLEWRDGYRDSGCKITQSSTLPFYQIRQLERLIWLDIDSLQTIYPSVAAAKAAAQAEYETRIRSALTVDSDRPATGKEGERTPYHIPEPKDGWRTVESFTDEEKAKLRPVAETLAMLDGNAFFNHGNPARRDAHEWYLPQADALYQSNGGDTGWASGASFAKGGKEGELIRDLVKANTPASSFSGGIIAKIAQVSAAVGMQANEPAMEIAGMIVSSLAANPENIERFMAEGTELLLSGAISFDNGSLTYRANNGSILSPSVLREKKGQQQ
jgi:hypothetical protein